MSGARQAVLDDPDAPISIAGTFERFQVVWAIRQRRLARLRCFNGHVMTPRKSMHLGEWLTCRNCLLIELIDSLSDPADATPGGQK